MSDSGGSIQIRQYSLAGFVFVQMHFALLLPFCLPSLFGKTQPSSVLLELSCVFLSRMRF